MTRSHLHKLALIVSTILASIVSVRADESQRSVENAAAEYGLAVGKKMPFHVADFLNGRYREGCPSVMVSNGKSRGIIVWTRADVATVKRLATALDANGVDGEKLRGFVVAYDIASSDLTEHKETWSGLKHVIVGKGRARPGINMKNGESMPKCRRSCSSSTAKTSWQCGASAARN